MTRRILYPGSFDPCTLGHVDLIDRAARIFDEVVVAVGRNIGKSALFGATERIVILEEVAADRPGVKVVEFDGLAVECAREQGCSALLRGVRNTTDFDYELTMAQTNQMLDAGLETVCLLPDPRFAHVSSRLIKEVYRFGGSVDELLPPEVARRMKEKHDEQ